MPGVKIYRGHIVIVTKTRSKARTRSQQFKWPKLIKSQKFWLLVIDLKRLIGKNTFQITYYCQGLNLAWTKFIIDKQKIIFISKVLFFAGHEVFYTGCDVSGHICWLSLVLSGSSTGILISSFSCDEIHVDQA